MKGLVEALIDNRTKSANVASMLDVVQVSINTLLKTGHNKEVAAIYGAVELIRNWSDEISDNGDWVILQLNSKTDKSID
jgi:hypothetical protein